MTLLKTNNCTKTAHMKSDDHTYNGWTNKPTWIINVHDFFDHDHLQEYVIPTAIEEAKKSVAGFDFKRKVEIALARLLEDEFDEFIYETGDTGLNIDTLNPVLHDLLNYAVADIDWISLAEHYGEDIDEVLEERG